jgi:hypothetical protein
MAQVFRRSANAIAKGSIVGAVALIAAVSLGAVTLDHSDYNTGAFLEKEQPVQFSHRHHRGDDGISCRYCHTSVEVSDSAGLPPTQTCMNCHSQIWADSPYLEPVRESWRTGRPIKWTKVHDLPDFVYFSHRAHVNKGVGCSTCHGDVASMAVLYQVTPLKMGWCLDCHREPERNLRPRDQIYNTKWQPPANQREAGLKLKREYNVLGADVLTSCSTCHR